MSGADLPARREDVAPRGSRLRGLFTTRRVVSSLALAIATGLLVIGFQGARDEQTSVRLARPAPVMLVFPAEGASSLRQEPIGAQLADDFTGELAVDGDPIPLDQTQRPGTIGKDNTPAAAGLAGLNQYSFTPGAGKEIERLAPGPHHATIYYWLRVGGSREAAESYSWTFSAS